MLFDSPSAPDLTTPTLEGLAWLLRHEEAWPVGFEWKFGYFSSCALGLARRTWPLSAKPHSPIYFNVGKINAYAIFRHGVFMERFGGKWLVTPEYIADRIDAYLARSQFNALR